MKISLMPNLVQYLAAWPGNRNPADTVSAPAMAVVEDYPWCAFAVAFWAINGREGMKNKARRTSLAFACYYPGLGWTTWTAGIAFLKSIS